MQAQRVKKSIWSSSVIEEEFNKRVDTEVTNLAESFMEIIEAARTQTPEDTLPARLKLPTSESKPPTLHIDDKHITLQKTTRMQVATASLVKSSESLLSITSELKRCLVLNDYAALNASVRARRAQILAQQSKIKETLSGLEDALGDVTTGLEKALFVSSTG
ncbi:hypothetical protein SmJEL517_g01112 [Synchytrium microbalum]|uniref:Uncharacterized protein n=1 Tax=Synchytrium microbalum TaxID=1806994 RepID=A0A507CG09_9FUNG|nr:uncharacterized protein SmJEL517_g01112 [Synchytrium microbalum]TPX36926.1 hypothetical protein SmJEL517_g01112 [Synchytrium microbalum]